MLFGAKPARVETPRVPECGEPPGWENRFQQLSSREGKELRNMGCDRDARLTNAEELVNKCSAKRPISGCAS